MDHLIIGLAVLAFAIAWCTTISYLLNGRISWGYVAIGILVIGGAAILAVTTL